MQPIGERPKIQFQRVKRLLENVVVLFLALYRVFKSPEENGDVRRFPTTGRVFKSAPAKNIDKNIEQFPTTKGDWNHQYSKTCIL